VDNAGRQLVDGNSWLGSRRGLPLPMAMDFASWYVWVGHAGLRSYYTLV
jgi:hypothetical protein